MPPWCLGEVGHVSHLESTDFPTSADGERLAGPLHERMMMVGSDWAKIE